MDEPGEPASTVPLGGRAVAISAGGFHSCALLAGGVVRCWGLGVSGQLGSGSTTNLMDQPRERPSAVRLGNPAVAISSAAAHTCAILRSGALQCWGNGDLEQLGPMARGRRMDAPGEAPARVPLGAKARSLAQGSDAQHACAVIAGGGIRCWGYDNVGQAGSGSSREAIGITAVRLGARAAGVAVGEAHSCAVLVTGAVRCWGRGDEGALGSGATRNLLSAPGETPSTVLRGVRLPTG
jgi:alpha-tubulin suppressor-like RCC1 family protein